MLRTALLHALLCALCGASLAEAESAAVPNLSRPEVDYGPLRAEVARAIATPPAPPCVHPAGAVLVTYANSRMFPLLLLQRHALEVGAVRMCLQRRFITVCLDAECLQQCARHHVPNCVDLGIQTVASPFLKDDYFWITYLKHEIMEAVLQGGAEELFFFDTDVVVFRDPWSVKLQDTGNLDLRYQVGNVPASMGQCLRGVNSGQVYLRRTNTTLAYLAAMRGYRAEILAGKAGGKLDQDFVPLAAGRVGLQHCGLDTLAFLGHCNGCYSDAVSGMPPVTSIVGMHADCAGDTEQKMQILAKFVAVRKAVAVLEAHGIAAPVTIKQALIC